MSESFEGAACTWLLLLTPAGLCQQRGTTSFAHPIRGREGSRHPRAPTRCRSDGAKHLPAALPAHSPA